MIWRKTSGVIALILLWGLAGGCRSGAGSEDASEEAAAVSTVSLEAETQCARDHLDCRCVRSVEDCRALQFRQAFEGYGGEGSNGRIDHFAVVCDVTLSL